MWIKICGIRDRQTAEVVVDAGADALGLNFFGPSPRAVTLNVAQELATVCRGRIERVGLFVNHSIEQVLEFSRQCDLDTVQLHGDEPPELIAQVACEFPVIRAFRVDSSGLEEVASALRQLQQLGVKLKAVLFDAKVAGAYGGTGEKAPWDILRQEWISEWPPLVLAGGLTPDNVSDAIRAVNPWGVDVAGGVELVKACKDPAMVREFVFRAREAANA